MLNCLDRVRWSGRLALLALVWVALVGGARDARAGTEKVTFDLIRFTPPAPLKKLTWTEALTDDKNQRFYTLVDPQAGTYCRIIVIKSTISAGTLDADFASEWKAFISNNREMLTGPQITDAAVQDGWQVKAGVGTFKLAGGESIAMLTSISGHGRVASVVAMTSSQTYLPAIQAFLGSIEMIKPPAMAAPSVPASPAKPAATGTAKPQALQGYMDYNPFTKSWTWKVRYPPPQ